MSGFKDLDIPGKKLVGALIFIASMCGLLSISFFPSVSSVIVWVTIGIVEAGLLYFLLYLLITGEHRRYPGAIFYLILTMAVFAGLGIMFSQMGVPSE